MIKLNELRNPPKVAAFKRFLTTGRDNSKNLSLVDKIRITKDPHDAAWRMLDADGWKHIGIGLSANVFMHPNHPDQILKLFDNDPAYVKWWHFCRANQSNPYVPRLRGTLKRLTKDFNVVRMERLAKVQSNDTELWIFLDMVVSPNPIPEDPHLDAIREFIWKIPEDHRDLHPGNVMRRGDRFVVIDPISGADDVDR